MTAEPSGRRLFLKGARCDFRHTGAIAPSSRFLGRAITRALGTSCRPLNVLEAGGGTGALTREIITRLPAGSGLDIYEINPLFAKHLADSFAGDGEGVSRIQVRVHNRRAQDIPAEPTYDAIISGLPLNNFEAAEVKKILETLLAALRPGGVLSYFEYLLIRGIKVLATGRRERRRLRKIGKVTAGFLKNHEFRREAVFLNIPPALVHHLRKR